MQRRDLNAAAPEVGDKRGEGRDLARGIEPAFGGHLLPPFRHETTGMRARGERDRQHLPRERHFKIERREVGRGEPCDVVVADVAAIFAQMCRDVVGTGLNREFRRA